jgi:predicted nucleic acid-binding protein
MICLDANYLIRCVELGSQEAARMQQWHRKGEAMAAPMPAWFEFICGPLTSAQEKVSRAFLKEILPFTEAEAQEAARLFNAVKRKRSLRVDAMIAATAIMAKAPLATNNHADFAAFLPHGLELI